MRVTLVKDFKLTGQYAGRCRHCGKSSPVWSCRVYVEGITERKQMFGREVDKPKNEYANWVLCAKHRDILKRKQLNREVTSGIEQNFGRPPKKDHHWPYLQQVNTCKRG